METTELVKKTLEYCLEKRNFNAEEIKHDLNLSNREWLFLRDFLKTYSFLRYNKPGWEFTGVISNEV